MVDSKRWKKGGFKKGGFSPTNLLQPVCCVPSIYSQIRQSVFAFCSPALCCWTTNRKSQKQQIIFLKWADTFFWIREMAFLALMQIQWIQWTLMQLPCPCTGTPFFAALGTNWQMRGLRRAVLRRVVHMLWSSTLQRVSSLDETATKTLLTSH